MDLTGLPSATAVVFANQWPTQFAWMLVTHSADVLGAVPVPELVAVKPLPEVINGLRNWVMGILAAVASLFLAVAGLRYVGSGGDPAVVEQAKGNFKAALVGYALAILSPVFLQILQGILGA